MPIASHQQQAGPAKSPPVSPATEVRAGPATKAAPGARPVLSLKGLTVELPPGSDRRHAIEDIDVEVHPGEIVCIVGESGSGKSITAFSVMGLLAREISVARGRIELEGENLVGKSDAEMRQLRGARMSMIFQEPMTALNPVKTCGDQIDEVLRIHTELSPEERKKRVIEVMTATHLPDPESLYDSYPHQLSGGQRQRVMIASALVLDPSLLIADEPTTALDVTTQKQILGLVRELQQRRGTGVLFITHDFGVVAEIADRVVVMQHGRIVESGHVEDVLLAPRHPYSKMLIASVPSLTPPERKSLEAAEVVLSTAKLDKIYGGGGFFAGRRTVHAAKDVNIAVRRGETVGIVGESGSGKSTVARCIARLIAPTGGSIQIGDIDVATLPERQLRPHRKRVQIVFQDPYRSLNPRRTVGDALIEGPVNFGLSREAARIRASELMKLVGLAPEAMQRFPHQFSGGQRQRICIARALMMEPELLIADEAVSALDVSVQAQVLKLLDDIRERFRLAVLFITHDLRVAAQVCDRIAVMSKGVVVEAGFTADIFRAPQHPYTQALFGAAPGRNFAFGGGIARA
jgi:peptide/nickel transport system ATP-binding protein